MDSYASSQDIAAIDSQLGANPLFVCDMDGNLGIGYTLAEGRGLPLGPQDNPANQDIPFGTSREQIAAHVQAGTLVPGNFAFKGMDVRIPAGPVDIFNAAIGANRIAPIALLTSGGAERALTIMAESGVRDPTRATIGANSGATLYLNGVETSPYPVSPVEEAFLRKVQAETHVLTAIVRDVVRDHGFDPAGMPDIYMEDKGRGAIGTNAHHNAILKAYGQERESPLDHAISAAVKEHLDMMVAKGPQDRFFKPLFTTLDGPATVETRVNFNKWHGLEAIVSGLLVAGARPTSIVFSGDDVSKGNGTPGTDYFAMIRADELQTKFGIPFFNVHTHHAEGGNMKGAIPSAKGSPSLLSADYPAPRVDLRLPSPMHNVDFIVEALSRRSCIPRLDIATPGNARSLEPRTE
jgi:hypothetical protein